MKELTSNEISAVSGASVLGVICYGTLGFWVGGTIGFFSGIWPAIPYSILGTAIGAYLGTDSPPQQPQVVYVVNSGTPTK